MSGSIRHVKALDGLRAVAVLPVVLFHLRVPGFRGGFLGVDVFFVLSGFLITSLLLAEASRSGTISLARFWSRRARRLMPALIIVLLAVCAATALSATLSQRESLRADLLSTTFYGANWRFISSSSYFSYIGFESPLEHAWSLAIEEQFYLVWPLVVAVLVWAFKSARAIGTFAGIAALGSMVLLAILWNPESVERAYMGTDARMFEPLLGAMGAVIVSRPWARALTGRAAPWLAGIGLAGIATGIAFLDEGQAYFFGGAAAVSVACLIAIIGCWGGTGGFVQRALEMRPLPWIGAISYGIYLWHWPLTVWTDARNNPTVARSLAVVGGTVAIAAASYYVIERPIRSGRRMQRARGRHVAVVAASMLMVVSGFTVLATAQPRHSQDTPVVMITGDSVPKRISVSLEQEAARRGWLLVTSAFGGCPVTGDHIVHAGGATLASGNLCPGLVQREQDERIEAFDPDVVLWWDRFGIADRITPEGEHIRADTDRFWRLRQRALEEHVARLGSHGARVVFMETEPPGMGIWSRCTPDWCSPWVKRMIRHYDDYTKRWNRMMAGWARAHPRKAAFVSITDAVCRTDVSGCDDSIDGVTARPDGSHYEGAGRTLAVRLILDSVAPYLG